MLSRLISCYMPMNLLNEYLKSLHNKYIDLKYYVKVNMLRNSMEKSSIANKPSLADLENEINRVMEEIDSRSLLPST